jgi:alpha(1,3/1,4) fucosyltransferase
MKLGFWNFYTLFKKNRLFEEGFTPVGDELAYPMVYLGKRLRELGHEVATLDMAPLEEFDKVFFIDNPTHLNPYFRKLRKIRHPDMHLIIAEPPIVRPDNYHPSVHRRFRSVFTWKRDLGSSGDKFHFYRIPHKLRLDSFSPVPFAERKLCVMINSFMVSAKANELYSERVRAIKWFEANAPADFDLIGLDWDKPLFGPHLSIFNFPLRFMYRRVPLAKKIKLKRFPSFIGRNKKSKHKTLHDYRFAIAYENSVEPDYISEKMWDSFFAGNVPIYLGAPEICDVVPKKTFIDKRDFRTYAELHRYIKGMSEREYNTYLEAIDAFIRTPAVKPFTAEGHAETFINAYVNP